MRLGWNVKLGIAAGIINCIVWYAIAVSLNFYSFDIERYCYYITLLLLITGIPTSVYLERKAQGGFIEFKDALKNGVLYCIVLALFIAIFNYIYYAFIVPDAIDYYVSEIKKSMPANKTFTEEEVANVVERIKSYFGSFRLFMSTVILGLLLSLGVSAVFRKKNPQAFQAN